MPPSHAAESDESSGKLAVKALALWEGTRKVWPKSQRRFSEVKAKGAWLCIAYGYGLWQWRNRKW